MAATTNAQGGVPWSVHDIQEQFCRSQCRYRTLVAGRRFGKNHAAIVSEADFCIDPESYPFGRDRPSEVVVWWIGPTYNQTKKYGFQKAKEAVPDELITDTRATQPFEIHLKNGVTWEFYSYDRPKSLDGAGVDSMVIDERGYMDTDIWEDNLAAMLLDTDGRVAFIGKPWPNQHFKECYEKGQSPEYSNYDSWNATSYDNPLIPDDRIDEVFGDMPEPVFRREIMAEFDAGGSIYNPGMFQFVGEDALPDARLKTIIAVDPAATIDAQRAEGEDSDYWAVVVGNAHKPSNTLYITDIARQRGFTLSQGCEWIGQITATARDATVIAEANAAQEWLIGELSDYGVYPEGVTSTREKEARLIDLTIPLNNGTIQFVDFSDGDPGGNDHKYTDLVTEAMQFPDGDHDDLLDALHKCAEFAPIELGATILSADPYSHGDDDDGDDWQAMNV